MKPGKLKYYINSINLQNHKRTEAVLQRLVSQYLSDLKQPFKHRYELQDFNSKEIERMLTMFENSRSGIRKLSLILITLVLMNSQSKIFFLEKCGLSLVTGKTFLTRLKYVSNFSSSMSIAFRHMRAILNELKQTPTLSNEVLFWYIPLEIKNRTINDLFLPRVKTFRISDIKLVSDVVDLSQLPDPVFNLCGIEFSSLDQRAKMMAIQTPKSQPFSHSAISHTRKSKRSERREPVKNNAKDYMQHSTRSTIIKSNREYTKSNAFQPTKKTYRNSLMKTKSPIGRQKVQVASGWNSQRKNPYENKSGIPLKMDIKGRNREVRRHTMMGHTGNYKGRGSKVNQKNGSHNRKSPYSNNKRNTFNFNGGTISSMHEVLGSDKMNKHKDLFGSKVYNKRSGKTTYSKLSMKNSRKSAKS